MSEEKFTLFWNGPFSQWLPSKFVIDGVEYNCCEQYMMAQKAIMFDDGVSLKEIMDADHPRDQKKLGRKVKNFSPEKWNHYAQQIVYDGNMAKFTQNPDLLKDLFATKGTTLVEASPYDKIWGIGMGANDPDAQNRDTWNGTNWLGEAITKVRETLLNYKPSILIKGM
jgi:ribA/ribD-fused uncharacterized protein